MSFDQFVRLVIPVVAISALAKRPGLRQESSSTKAFSTRLGAAGLADLGHLDVAGSAGTLHVRRASAVCPSDLLVGLPSAWVPL